MKNWIPLLLLAVGPLLAATPALIPLPGGPGPDTGESSLVTAADDGTAYLTWAGPDTAPDADAGERALHFATLAPGDHAWSAPRPIVSTPLLMENWADFATLAVGTDGTLWAQWYQNRGDGQRGYDGWFARSTDGGETWPAPAALGHEFVSLAPLSGGRMLAVWLASTRTTPMDHGSMHAAMDHGSAAPAAYQPSMRLRSRLLAADGSTLQDWTVDPDVCTCCQTTLAVLPDDHVLVAYRGHTPDEIRDQHLATFDGTTWGAPRLLHADDWKIAACPVNGPAADARGGQVAITWFTAAQGEARVQVKFSADGGETFGPAQRVDLGHPIGRLDLVSLPDGSAVVSWLELSSEEHAAGLYVARFFPDGRASEPVRLVDTSAARASGFARMALQPGEDWPVVITWTATAGQAADGSALTRVDTARFSAAALVPNPSSVGARR